jgi:hypothetical protein
MKDQSKQEYVYFRVYSGEKKALSVMALREGRNESEMLCEPQGIALDLNRLNQAKRAGAVRIQGTDTETGAIDKSTLERIKEAGIEIDRGFGEQLVLPPEGWVPTRRGQSEQLRLFQGASS